jgi:hypothetical protein
MSLPRRCLIDWQRLERDVAGLRIGLMMDAGVGTARRCWMRSPPPAVEGRGQAVRGGRRPRRAHRAVHDARHARRHGRLLAHARLARPLGVARGADARPHPAVIIVAWAKRGATLSGERVFRGYSQMAAMRDAAVAGCGRTTFVLSPTSPIAAYAAELPSPTTTLERLVRAHRLHARLQHERASRREHRLGPANGRRPRQIGLQIVGRAVTTTSACCKVAARLWEANRGRAPSAVAGSRHPHGPPEHSREGCGLRMHEIVRFAQRDVIKGSRR